MPTPSSRTAAVMWSSVSWTTHVEVLGLRVPLDVGDRLADDLPDLALVQQRQPTLDRHPVRALDAASELDAWEVVVQESA